MELIKPTDATDIELGNVRPGGKDGSPGLRKTKTKKMESGGSLYSSRFQKPNDLNKDVLANVEGTPDLTGNYR